MSSRPTSKRGWEKPGLQAGSNSNNSNSAPAVPTPAPAVDSKLISPITQINKIVNGMIYYICYIPFNIIIYTILYEGFSENEAIIHRAAFLHLMQSITVSILCLLAIPWLH